VHHPRFVVHVAQRQQDLREDVPEKRFGRARVRRAEPGDALRQRRALRELHHDEHRASVLEGLDVPHDVRMVKPRQDAHLARHRVREIARNARETRLFFEIFFEMRLGEGTKTLVLREHLLHGARRADAARARLVRAVHLAEGALAQALHQRVPAHDAGRARGTLAGGVAREKKTRAPVVEEKTVAIRGAFSRFLERVRESRRARLREPKPPRRDVGVPIELGLVLPDVDERREEVRREQSLEGDAHAFAVARKNKTQRAKRVRARLFARRRGFLVVVGFCEVGRRARVLERRRRLGVRRASLERLDQHAPERVDAVGARDGFAAVVVGGESRQRRTTQTRRRRLVRLLRGLLLPQPPKHAGDHRGRARGARLGHRRAVVQESAQHAKR